MGKRKFLFAEKDEDIRKRILVSNPFVHSGVVYRKDSWIQVGGYDETLYLSQDFDLWAKLGKIGKMHNIRKYYVNFSSSSKSRTNQKIHKHILLKQKIRKRYQRDYPNFYKSYLLGWIVYGITFLPFQKKIRIFLRKIFLRKYDQ